MIDTVDQRLEQWMAKLARPAKVFLTAPSEMDGKEGVSLHLLELITNPPPRGAHRTPLVISLRYLVTVWFGEAQKSHRILGDLMFAALEEKEMEVEAAALPLAAWPALGVGQRPALLLRVKLSKPRPEKIAPRVRGRVGVRFGAMIPLHGQVVGPGGSAIPAATISLPSLSLTTRTDSHGRFLFTAVPKEPPIREVQINARGCDVSFPVPEGAEGGALLIKLTEQQI